MNVHGSKRKSNRRLPKPSSLPKTVRFLSRRNSIRVSMQSSHGADSQRILRYVDALCEGVADEMELDPRVFVFGLDVDDHKAIQGSTRGLQQRFGRDRVFNTPLSE